MDIVRESVGETVLVPGERVVPRHVDDKASDEQGGVFGIEELHFEGGVRVVLLEVGGPEAEVESCVVAKPVDGYLVECGIELVGRGVEVHEVAPALVSRMGVVPVGLYGPGLRALLGEAVMPRRCGGAAEDQVGMSADEVIGGDVGVAGVVAAEVLRKEGGALAYHGQGVTADFG